MNDQESLIRQGRPGDERQPDAPASNESETDLAAGVATLDENLSAAEAAPAAEEPEPLDGLTPGRIVRYVLEGPYSAGEPPRIRPAMIITVWDHFAGTSNLQVFLDGDNDLRFTENPRQTTLWKTSRLYSKGNEPGTWHFPPGA